MKIRSLLCAALLGLTSFAQASDTPENSVRLGYSSQDDDALQAEFEGFELGARYAFLEQFAITGQYIHQSDRGLDFDRTSVGIEYIFSKQDAHVWYSRFDIVRLDFERDYAGGYDDIGYQVGVGYRTHIADDWGLSAEISHLAGGEVDPTFGDYAPTFLTLGADYQLSNAFALYADYEYEKESQRYTVGMRYSF